MRTRRSLVLTAVALVGVSVAACQPARTASAPPPSTVVSTVTQPASSSSAPVSAKPASPSVRVTSAAPSSKAPTVAPQTYGPIADHPTVYLVELGKGSYGCSDKLVPGIKVPDSNSPVRDAMTQLVTLKTGAVGESGLTNSLAQSTLAYADGKYDAATGLVQVWLTGNIVTGGTCDIPRIIGQLEMTALSAAQGAKAVQIFVNDKPLKDVLSMR